MRATQYKLCISQRYTFWSFEVLWRSVSTILLGLVVCGSVYCDFASVQIYLVHNINMSNHVLYLGWVLPLMRQSVAHKRQVQISKVKVTVRGQRSCESRLDMLPPTTIFIQYYSDNCRVGHIMVKHITGVLFDPGDDLLTHWLSRSNGKPADKKCWSSLVIPKWEIKQIDL